MKREKGGGKGERRKISRSGVGGGVGVEVRLGDDGDGGGEVGGGSKRKCKSLTTYQTHFPKISRFRNNFRVCLAMYHPCLGSLSMHIATKPALRARILRFILSSTD